MTSLSVKDNSDDPGSSIRATERKYGNTPFRLGPSELWWRDRSILLESRGYLLRPRFRPGWIPSWIGTGKDPYYCEDAFAHMIPRVMDAQKTSNGALVTIKQVSAYSTEAEIGMRLSTPDALKDPYNHCVPILDHFQDATAQENAFIVMPLLRRFDEPPFYVVSEVLDFVRQMLEGLVYMHRRKVAHCDLSHLNIMMDGKALFPKGFHPDPTWQNMLPDFSTTAKYKLRSDVKGIKYYIIDYDYSAYYGDSDEPPLAYGDDGLDRELPELSWGRPYDPFPGDVFTLGNVFKKSFVEKYANLSFLEPLATAMTQKDPADRPTAEEALTRFEDLANKLDVISAHWRLRPVKETRLRCAVLEIYWTVREFSRVSCGLFASSVGGVPAIMPITLAMLVILHGPRRTMDRIRTLFIRLY